MNASAAQAEVVINVEYDRSTQTQLATKAPELSRQLAITITDQASLDAANEAILIGNEWCKSVDRIMDPVREATHKAWKAAIKAQDEFKAPVLVPLMQLKTEAANFVFQARQDAERRQREADEEQRRNNDTEAREWAKQLKSAGATKQEITAAKEEIKATPAPTVAPTVEVPSGSSVGTLYSAEVTNLPEFLTYLLTERYLMNLLTPVLTAAIEKELRFEASRLKDKYSIPGTKLVKKPRGAWRG